MEELGRPPRGMDFYLEVLQMSRSSSGVQFGFGGVCVRGCVLPGRMNNGDKSWPASEGLEGGDVASLEWVRGQKFGDRGRGHFKHLCLYSNYEGICRRIWSRKVTWPGLAAGRRIGWRGHSEAETIRRVSPQRKTLGAAASNLSLHGWSWSGGQTPLVSWQMRQDLNPGLVTSRPICLTLHHTTFK